MYKIWTIFWGWSIIGQFTIRMPNCQGTKKPTTSPTIHYSVYSHKLYLQKLPRELTRENTQESQAKVKNERTNERTREQARQIEQLAWGKFALGLGQRQRCGAQLQRAFNLLRWNAISSPLKERFVFILILYYTSSQSNEKLSLIFWQKQLALGLGCLSRRYAVFSFQMLDFGTWPSVSSFVCSSMTDRDWSVGPHINSGLKIAWRCGGYGLYIQCR